MKVGLIAAVGSPWARQLALRMQKLGTEVHFISFRGARGDSYLHYNQALLGEAFRELEGGGIRVHLLSERGPLLSRYFLAGPEVHWLARRQNLDILFPLYGGGFGFMAYSSGFRPYAVYTVGDDVLLLKGFKRQMVRQVLKQAHIIFSNGRHLKDETDKLLGTKSAHSLLLGTDAERFRLRPEAHGPEIRIICTRGFEPVYNNQSILEALNLLPPTTPSYRMVFTSTGSLFAKTKTFAEQHLRPEVFKRVSFLGGVSNDDLLGELQAADIYVSMSLSDGSSISLQEAMACGAFPILSDIPSNREWIFPEQNNGDLVSLYKPMALAIALKNAIEGGERREAARAGNRELVIQKAHSMSNTQKLIEMLKNSLNPSNHLAMQL